MHRAQAAAAFKCRYSWAEVGELRKVGVKGWVWAKQLTHYATLA